MVVDGVANVYGQKRTDAWHHKRTAFGSMDLAVDADRKLVTAHVSSSTVAGMSDEEADKFR